MKVNHLTLGRIVQLSCATLLIGLDVAVTCVANTPLGNVVTEFFQGQNYNFDSQYFTESSKASRGLNVDLVGEGGVLLKNDTTHGGGLPLSSDKKKINLFGFGATDNGFIYSGIGSGLANLSDRVTLQEAFKKKGVEVNQDILNVYGSIYSSEFSCAVATRDRLKIFDPPVSTFTPELIQKAKDFSDTAVVVISRQAGENVGEVALKQDKYNGTTDGTRSMLQISTEEEDLLKLCEENFENVVVVVNSGLSMELGFLKDEGIDAALNVGIVGVNGTEGIVGLLYGDYNPSGRTVDTFISNHAAYDPTYLNFDKSGNDVQYLEDLYFGYKYYETRCLGDEESYHKMVDYPFGYGLSYTSFEWELTDVSLEEGSDLVKEGTTEEGETDDSKVTLTFSVTNTGKVAGKDVLELYGTAPYTEGGIEKSAIQLLDFAKTALIQPGMTQTDVTMSFSTYDLASYDAYDKNGNHRATWEVEPGEYQIKVMKDAHTPATLKGRDPKNGYILTYNVPNTAATGQPATGYYYLRDPKTKRRLHTRFTGSGAYSGVPIDGSTVGVSKNYMSRSDFAGTYPEKATGATNSAEVEKADSFVSPYYDTEEMPKLGEKNGLYLFTQENGSPATEAQLSSRSGLKSNDSLIQELVEDYDSPKWDQLVSQLNFDEMQNMVDSGGWGTRSFVECGKPGYLDSDGPAGFNRGTTSTQKTPFTGFACETTIAQSWSKNLAYQMGLSIGAEGSAAGVNGWYAPAVNLHRSQFNYRNYEYYSEDPVLSGRMAANVITGAESNGVYPYLKHFALSELGENPANVNVWLTEQNLRENYLKAFEIAVKEGHTNAIMTAFNGIGGVYCGWNYALNVSILRNEWGFRGSLITDYAASGEMRACQNNLRGGNDLRLANDAFGKSGLSASNPTDVYVLKLAAKNVIYTDIDTYWFSKNYDHSKDKVVSTMGKGTYSAVSESFPVWKGILYGVDVVVLGCCSFWLWWIFFHEKKPKPETETSKEAEKKH